VRTHFLTYTVVFSLCPLMVGVREHTGMDFVRAPIPFIRAPTQDLITS
jgi:hypothetical protein